MKILIPFLMFIGFVPSVCAQTCAEKIAAVELKIANAKVHNHKDQIAGLEKALAETKANCTDEKLKTAKDEKIKGKEEDVAEARTELDKAAVDGKPKQKIEKKKKKLEKKLKELEEAKTP